jgi:hypothetical protein
MRQVGASFADVHKFTSLFCTPSLSKSAHPRSSSGALGKTAERTAVGTFHRCSVPVFDDLLTLRQLRIMHHRVVQHRTNIGLPCDR